MRAPAASSTELTVRADEAGHRRLLEFAGRLDERARVGDRGLPQPLAALERPARAGERVSSRAAEADGGGAQVGQDVRQVRRDRRAGRRPGGAARARSAGRAAGRARSARSRCCSITARTWSSSAPGCSRRLRWLLHELDPTIEPAGRSLDNCRSSSASSAGWPSSRRARCCASAASCSRRIRELTVQVRALAARPRDRWSPATRRRCSRSPASA